MSCTHDRPGPLVGSKLGGVATIVALLAAAACSSGSSDGDVFEPVTIFTEYTYEITDGSGDCDEIPRSSGGGVVRVIQESGSFTICSIPDLCTVETCRSGVVTGSTFVNETDFLIEDGPCSYFIEETYTVTEIDSGTLEGSIRRFLTFAAGDCSEVTLPCDTTQTFSATACEPGCYDELCAGGARANGAPGKAGL